MSASAATREEDGAAQGARESELRIRLLGTEVRVLVGVPAAPGAVSARRALARVEAELAQLHHRLSRFTPDGDLGRLNRDPGEVVPASALLRTALESALWAAAQSHGLVDPTLAGELECAGYAQSRDGVAPASLPEAIDAAPPRTPARARPDARWKEVRILPGAVSRPPGMRLDLGGTAKGLAADRCATFLSGHSSFAVDLGGDVVVGGVAGLPRQVDVDHPLASAPAARFALARGAVATSGLATRIWEVPGGFSHHLIDPSTGMPAWTGVIQATAIGRTGVESEMLAKTALLSGPDAGLAVLEQLGGALVLDDGEVLITGLPAGGDPV